MNIFSLILIALAMSGDAFAVAVSRGVALKDPDWQRALKNGALFGFTESIAPLVGWLLGSVAVKHVMQWDHWIIFGILSFLGARMIKNGFSAQEKEREQYCAGTSFFILLLLAISTSLDSFALGITFAFAEVNIVVASLMIGSASFFMVTMGIMLGRKLGRMVGKRAGIAGGAVLVFIGLWTLYEHLAG